MSEVRTHWHHMVQAVRAGNLYLLAPDGLPCEPMDVVGPAIGWRPAMFDSLLDMTQRLPYFVFDREVMEYTRDPAVIATMRDMKTAGVFRLPFATMVVELPREKGVDIVVLRDRGSNVPAPWGEASPLATDRDLGSCEFYGMVFMYRKDEQGEYALYSTPCSYVDLETRSENCTVRIGAAVSGAFDPADDLQRVRLGTDMQGIYLKAGKVVATALMCGVVMLATQGVAREVVQCDKLNRARTATGKPAIPRHTYIHIGKVYRSAAGNGAADSYVPRRSPRPHWVRGHLRNYRTGKGRTGPLRPHFIPPMFVAWRGDEVRAELEAPPPSYDVRR